MHRSLTSNSHGPEYAPPRVDRLGTLAELTQGALAGPDDGLGGNGSALG